MIVITGASDGLGKEVAKLYKEAGKTVVNISRRECEYADVNICHSLREGEEIESAVSQVLAMEDKIEAYINCVGVFNNQKIEDITESEIKRLMSTNGKAFMLMVSGLLDRMKLDGTDILNVLSTAALVPKPDEPLYVASKWAARGFTLSLQKSLKDTPCRVVSFCPGGMDTDFFDKAEANVDTSTFMKPADIAVALKQTLDLPKNMEVSEIIINRK